jgi:serine/threonine-protein kinase
MRGCTHRFDGGFAMAQADPSLDSLIGQVESSKFHVRRVIGAGGMGAVFEAEHAFTKRVGALKLLHEQFARVPEVVERFTREASAAGRIANPHIVETYDAGRLDSGQPYMFMELLTGRPLDDVLQERGQLPYEQAIRIAIQAATGLYAAHQAGIVHRDIKPANLFLVDGEAQLVKLLDFGISKFNVSEPVSQVTQEGTMLGTPQYMAPEQVMGRADVDERVDVYALGVLLYESVVGQAPFVEPTLGALAVRICQGQYTKPSEHRPDLPHAFDAVIARCLAVDRDQRYPSMAPLIDDLRAMIGSYDQVSLAPTMIAPSVLGNRTAVETARTLLSNAPPPPRSKKGVVWAVLALLVLGASAAAYQWVPRSEPEAVAPTLNPKPEAQAPQLLAEPEPSAPRAIAVDSMPSVVFVVPSASSNVEAIALPSSASSKPVGKPRALDKARPADDLERKNPFE